MIRCHIPLLPRHRILPNIYDFPLNDEDQISWQEFKNFDYGTPSLCGLSKHSIERNKRIIGLDHPFVKVVADFAIAAFNKSCQMYVKKDEYYNLHDCDLFECKYLKRVDLTYYFYITFEAIEEGTVGVYEAKVVCRGGDNIKLTLIKCVLTNRTPARKKAMALSHLYHLGSLYKSVQGLKKYTEIYVDKYMKGKKKANPTAVYLFKKWTRMSHACDKKKLKALIRLKYLNETVAGLQNEIDWVTMKLLSPGCTRMTNQDDWIAADEDYYSGLLRRRGTTYRGYDFSNPLAALGDSIPW